MFDRFFEDNMLDEAEAEFEREAGPVDHPANEPLSEEEVESLAELAEAEFDDSTGQIS